MVGQEQNNMQRLLIVSNRLPINVSQGDSNEKWKFQLSSGGLVSALAGVQKSTKFIWIGWPGIDIADDERLEFCETLFKEHSSIPVFIDKHTSDLHYNGFSNSTIWPLFHYLPADTNISEEQWQGYKRANQIFADYVSKIVEDDDIIWVHDYHLMLLPEMLRSILKSKGKTIKIGFFLHIPFPTSEVYRVLPYRKEVLTGILNSDLIGFHTYDYARHFLTSCTRILGSNTSPTSVDFNGRTVKVGAYPVGVEPEKFEETLRQEATCLKIKELEEKYKGLYVIIGVERLDYIKGLTQKLLAFEEFLKNNAEFIGKVVLIQIAIPSRTEVPEYQKLQNQVFELVGRINGKFSNLNYSPVQFIYNSVNFTELVALYRIADVCLVTSTRDGMNLVACEYIASQVGKYGVLILSEFAGSAQSLNGAILVNPWNLREIERSIKTALTMIDSQKMSDHSHLLSYVKKFTSIHWGQTFISDLQATCNVNPAMTNLPSFKLNTLSEILRNSKTLIIANNAKILEDLNLKISSIMPNYDRSFFCLFSNENVKILNNLLFNGYIFAESGLFFRSQHDGPEFWAKTTIDSAALPILNWSEQLLNILKYYSERVPSSKIEASEALIAWKFGSPEVNFSKWIASELQMNLEKLIGHLPLKVQRNEHELRIMHSATDFVKIGTRGLINFAAMNNFTQICIIDEGEAVLREIAEALNSGSDIKVFLLSL